MRGKLNNSMGKQQADLQRDERLGALLRDAQPAPGLLSWRQVEQLVPAAPPPRRPWFDTLLHAPAPLRYAMAPLLLALVSAGTLWVMPAQSEQVGTMVVTTLPVAWTADNAALAEVQQSAQREFSALKLNQGSLQMLTAERAGQDRLVFTMLEARRAQAEQVVGRLEAQYPALAAYTPEYVDVTADPQANRLAELVEKVRTGVGRQPDQSKVASQVLKALHAAGLSDVDVQVKPQPDGSVVVEIAATYSMKLRGHTQEELAAAGLDADTLGAKRYQQLLEQLGAPAQGR
jgi:hypothetical protein